MAITSTPSSKKHSSMATTSSNSSRECHFPQTEPLGFAGGDANLVRYVSNAPTRFTDPFGLQEQDPQFRSNVSDPPQTVFLTIYAGHFKEILETLETLHGFFGDRLGPNKIGVCGCFGIQAESRLTELFGKDAAIPGRNRTGKLLRFDNAPDYLEQEFLNAQRHAKELIRMGKAEVVVIQIDLSPDFERLLRDGCVPRIDPKTYKVSKFQKGFLNLPRNAKDGDRFQTVFIRPGLEIPLETIPLAPGRPVEDAPPSMMPR